MHDEISSERIDEAQSEVAPTPADLIPTSLAPGWTLWLMVLIASVAIFGDCLLTCPSQFSEKHQRDTSLLRPIVTALGLGGRFPTARGVEIRNLAYYSGAAALTGLAGLGLIFARRRCLLSLDDLFDVRTRATGPIFWWVILLMVSAFSSFYSHAPEVCRGQTTIRLMHLAWWWPLAALLEPRQARRLCAALLAALALTAALGLWYHVARIMPTHPDARLQYPIGNELWLAACLLPAVLIAESLLMEYFFQPQEGCPRPSSYLRAALLLLVLLCVVPALVLTRSRSALAGLGVGLVVLLGFSAQRAARRKVALVGVVAALGAAAWMQYLRIEGAAGQRAHSIRTRLNYEWPYALNLALKKPVAGHGDGAYSLLAGRYARVDQIDDPSTIRFDESSWTAHAHNEFLELLSDVGVVGAAAFLCALALTLYHALRFCDAARTNPAWGADRWLVIGLSSALAAMAVEQCGESALREPGLPAIFFTVWAVLWALVRRVRLRASPSANEPRLASGTLRLAGAAVLVVGGILAFQGISDWSGARARFRAGRAMDAGQYATARREADLASANLLDPFQRSLARMIAVWARSLSFDEALAKSAAPPSEADMTESADALVLLGRLNDDAPRFLRLSRLAAELQLNRARAFERRGEKDAERDARKRFLEALTQSRFDEPFMIDRIMALWRANPEARSVDRLFWLRCLLRNNEITEEFTALFQDLPRYGDFRKALEDTFAVAQMEARQPPAQWKDRLAPETFRLAALARMMAGLPGEAEQLAGRADELYTAAGPRLFVAHAAAIHEMVRYSLARDARGDPDKNLERLARAQTILAPPTSPTQPLRGGMGLTRLMVLLAAGREADARLQAEFIASNAGSTVKHVEYQAWLELAGICSGNSLQSPRVLEFAEAAVRLVPDSAASSATLAIAYLLSRDDRRAAESIRQFIRLAPSREAAISQVRRFRMRFPAGGVWEGLEREYPELKPATTQISEPRP